MKKIKLILVLPLFVFSQDFSNEKKEFDKIYENLNNTGKWGDNDVKGTINYISNEKIISALKMPKYGDKVSLSFNLSNDSTTIGWIRFSNDSQC